MEFKKCDRCGCFYSSNDNVCCNCLIKDNAEINKFKSFIEENNVNELSLNNISLETGISKKSLNRFLGYEDFSNISNQIKL